jgi:hypothetical protein
VDWACIRLAHHKLLKWVAATRSYLATTSDVDPLSCRVNSGSGLTDQTSDYVRDAADVIFAHQFRLLAFQNRWIRSDIVEIPGPDSHVAPEQTAHQLRKLAAIWHQVECPERPSTPITALEARDQVVICDLIGTQVFQREERVTCLPCVDT